ncbi:MAG: hypothetical protein Fur0022_41180 [Anaerolineales bacterium]
MHSLTCPNCGAPLTDQTGQKLWLCIYCNTLLRVPTEPAAQLTVEKTVSDDDMTQIKLLLYEGKREEAVTAYQHIAQCSLEDAEKAVGTLTREYAFGILRRQQLTGYGIALVILYNFALVLSLLAWVRGVLNPIFALAIAGFSAFNLWVFSRAIRTTLQYLTAPKARAVIQHYTQTGKIQVRGGTVYTFKVLLNVQPANGSPFQDTMIVPVREQRLDKMRQGTAIWVKYKPGEPGSLLFDELEK